MGRKSILAVLVLFALPLCAQHRWVSAPHGGGSVHFRSNHGGFSPRGGVTFRGGVSFGHNPSFRVFVGSGSINHARRWSVYPYRYAPSYVYPYVIAPAYPLAYYNSYDYAAPVVPAYRSYEYGYASGGDNDREVGLAEQMRQQNVGIYQRPPNENETQAATEPVAKTDALPNRRPTVLVYRDGQRAEIQNYAIVGQTLWVFSEQRASKVPLAQLDLDATQKANEERGIEFVVPAVR
jgi:hypothetical protein